MYRVKVVKATTSMKLEEQINLALDDIAGEYVDIKISGAYNGKYETFMAVIIYKAYC
ncbi:glucose-6-phosphate dehydrogenase assembly protein OpcA [Bacillus fengqiuensis]|nr:glucose-6-phosphate dehydrogenase assembly protein OpcA [Bacillus fengqiuensis]